MSEFEPGVGHNNPPVPIIDDDNLLADNEHILHLAAISQFDYTKLQRPMADAVWAEAQAIRANLQTERVSIRDTGYRLIRVKELLGHGEFGNWIKVEFRMSAATASRYMNVARRLSPDEFCSLKNFASNEVIYRLTAKRTSTVFLEQLLDDIKRGELSIPNPALEQAVKDRIKEALSGAILHPTKKQMRGFEEEVWAKHWVSFLKEHLGEEHFAEFRVGIKACGSKCFLRYVDADRPAYQTGFATGDVLVGQDGLPLTNEQLIDYCRDRDTTPPSWATDESADP